MHSQVLRTEVARKNHVQQHTHKTRRSKHVISSLPGVFSFKVALWTSGTKSWAFLMFWLVYLPFLGCARQRATVERQLRDSERQLSDSCATPALLPQVAKSRFQAERSETNHPKGKIGQICHGRPLTAALCSKWFDHALLVQVFAQKRRDRVETRRIGHWRLFVFIISCDFCYSLFVFTFSFKLPSVFVVKHIARLAVVSFWDNQICAPMKYQSRVT